MGVIVAHNGMGTYPHWERVTIDQCHLPGVRTGGFKDNFERSVEIPNTKRKKDEEKPTHLMVNLSPAEKDWELYEFKRMLQDRSSWIGDPEKVARFEELKAKYDNFLNPEEGVAYYREEIRVHLDKRIQLFFQQLILCYNTPFHYGEGGAEDQFGKGSRLKFDGKTYATEGAHPAVLPSLHAYFKDANGQPDRTRAFVFLKHSSAYYQQNATDELPNYVNKLDSLVDGKSSDRGKLRNSSLHIINEVASCRLDPVRGMKQFLADFRARLETVQQELQVGDSRLPVLELYLEHVRDNQEMMRNNVNIFDRFMGVKIANRNEDVLRTIVYKKRFELIQTAEKIDSEIKKRILDAQLTFFGVQTESTKHVRDELRYKLLRDFTNPWERKCLERLLCVSFEDLNLSFNRNERLRRSETRETWCNQVTKLTNTPQKAREIANLERDIRHKFIELAAVEALSRSHLFRDLRTSYCGWTQEGFSQAYLRQHPADAMSRSTVRRIERLGLPDTKPADEYLTPVNQRKKLMSVEKAIKIAGVFGVDPGVFLPSLFTSTY